MKEQDPRDENGQIDFDRYTRLAVQERRRAIAVFPKRLARSLKLLAKRFAALRFDRPQAWAFLATWARGGPKDRTRALPSRSPKGFARSSRCRQARRTA